MFLLKKDAENKDNVVLLNIQSFEFALLSFENLEQWVFAEDDELKDKRAQLLKTKDFLVRGGDCEALESYKNWFPYVENHNLEQIYAKLLYEITRNTGFETDKRQLGECFVNDCCGMKNRRSDDICGLDGKRLNSYEKKRQIVDYSALKTAFSAGGLI